MPSITLVPAHPGDTIPNAKATFTVGLLGFTVGQALELAFVEMAASAAAERVVGVAKGRVANVADPGTVPRFSIIPDTHPGPPSVAAGQAVVAFRLAKPSYDDGRPGDELVYVFEMQDDHADVDEGEWWSFEVRVDALGVRSSALPVAKIRRQIHPRAATYDWHDGNDVRLYNDGSTDENGGEGAFKEMLDAIADARHFVFIVDWSFHPSFRPDHQNEIGQILIEKAKSGVLVAIHVWEHGTMFAADAVSNHGGSMLEEMVEGVFPDLLLWRCSKKGSTTAHHQKYVLVDCEGFAGRRAVKAFFGGLDITKGRFDWSAHPILPIDQRCRAFREQRIVEYKAKHMVAIVNNMEQEPVLPLVSFVCDDWYSPEFSDDRDLPRQPWHDVHAMVKGPAAWDMVREFVGRWCADQIYDAEPIIDAFESLFDVERFVQQWEPHSGLWAVQVCRSMMKKCWHESRPVENPARHGGMRELVWQVDRDSECSIQEAYLNAIDQAEKFIYIEAQYFIGSGHSWALPRDSVENAVPERIASRIVERIGAGASFHVYVVMPMFPEGNPIGLGIVAQRQFEWRTMECMARLVYKAAVICGKDWRDYLSFCFLANWNTVANPDREGTRKARVGDNQRYMIYVHSKAMIVDDRQVIVGSCNLNDRGLMGDQDTEICCAMWPSRGRESDCVEKVREFRKRLWLEHFSGEALGEAGLPEGWEDPSPSICVGSIREKGLRNYIRFRAMQRDDRTDGHLCVWPLQVDMSAFFVESVSGADEDDQSIPDAPRTWRPRAKHAWLWHAPGRHAFRGLAE